MLLPGMLSAQFYNGMQMQFGKNRVQHREFLWQYFRFEKFDTYYYVNGRELAEYTGQVAQEELPKIESFFQHNMEKRIIFIVYNKLSDFKQSNIGLLTGDQNDNIGGVTQIINNKVFLYFEGDRKKLKEQVKSAIAEVILNEMIYGSNFKERLANSTLINIPEWYSKGLFTYLSKDWDFETENRVKDGVLSGKYEKFNHLSGDDAVYAGHSIWKYIADTYGKSTIPNIIYLTRIHKNPEEGFLYVLGISFESLAFEWMYSLKERYTKELEGQTEPDVANKIVKPKKGSRVTDACLSPDGKQIAYVTNQMGRYKIWLYNIESGKKRKIFQREHKLDQITDYTYPVLAWHPSATILSFIIERKGKTLLNLYNLDTKQTDVTQLFYFEKILDYSYSDDGFKLVMSATIKGHSDLYIHNLLGHTNEQLTFDFADDLNPRFINNSNSIVFSSNRASEIIDNSLGADVEINDSHDIFIYHLNSKSNVLTRLTNSPYVDDVKPLEIDKNRYSFLSNENGIFNRYLAEFDSTISYIDTTTHYRYFTISKPLSNYTRNVNSFEMNDDDDLLETVWYNDRDYILLSKNNRLQPVAGKLGTTSYRLKHTRNIIAEDSVEQAKMQKLEQEIEEIEKAEELSSDSLIDITSYKFEVEKQNSPVRKKFLLKKKRAMEFILPKSIFYNTAFYSNYMVNQIDFSFLNASYQTFTGGAVYYNPGLNFFFKVGLLDLFEDYRITGGMRLSTDFESNEYLLSIQNLKKRVDEEVIFHRQTFREIGEEFALKNYTHELMYIRRLPFSQVAAVEWTATVRNDRNVFLSSDNVTLNADNIYKTWGGLKMSYTFDNTRQIALNLYNGTRFKLFAESFWKMESESSSLYVVGADFRHYIPIHREIIWANRFAASTSFGSSRLVYYLGSVDNWLSFISSEEVFDKSVAIDPSQNFEYQTLASNMRGFRQNIRNGNSFALYNSEIRIPIVRYLMRRPVNSDFFANLQTVGFFDIGTAWSGPDPYSQANAYNYTVVENGPITVTLNKDIEPIVYGYGFGLRSRLLGYFIRADWAWGVEDQIIQPRMFYLSLSLDF